MPDPCLPLASNTPNTTRFAGQDQYETAVAVAEAVWNDPTDPMKHPGTVILARGDGLNYQEALISTPLIHFPRNGPVLLTEPDRLTPVVEQEIIRLNPTGLGVPAPVMIVGSLSTAVDEAVRRLGYAACRLDGGDPAATAVLIWRVLGPKRNVLLVSGQNHAEAMLAGGWAAHMGDPILLTGAETLPRTTACAIAGMQPDVYIIGGPGSVSPAVEGLVRRLTPGLVARIGGRDPVETAVEFTKYKSSTGHFGWGVNRRNGWAFRFSRFDQWYGSLSGNPLSHMGKHAPLLLLPSDHLPLTVEEYLLAVNPRHAEPKPPLMHGFLVDVWPGPPCQVQYRLDGLLETVAGSR